VTQLGVQQETPFTRFNRDRIDAFVAQSTSIGGKRVLLLGSSALKYATREDTEFASRISHASGSPVSVLRITSNWGTYFDFASLVEDILAVRPDLVVLETEFLAADRPPSRRFILWMRQLRTRLGFEVKEESESIPEPEVQFSYPCWHRKASRGHQLLLQERARWVVVRPDGPGPRGARGLVESILDAGAKVALVSVPRRPDYEAEARPTRIAAIEGPQGRRLNGRVLLLEPGPIPKELFCDLIHVTPVGRAHFSNWLELQVAQALAGPAS
jgi:hypothetical protein